MRSFVSTRFRPLEALRALRALLRDPDDTAQVFRIISAVSGGARARMLRRLQRTSVGQRVLRDPRPLASLLLDRARLAQLPAGSLGREYLAFCERHGITADGLIAASELGSKDDDLTPEERVMRARMRDAHDLWHVVTGYQTDLIGEASVLAFTVAQTKNPGVALIVLSAFIDARGDRSATRMLLIEAFLRGLHAEWLPAADWEALLERPLAEVRRELGIGAPPVYTPVWPHDVYPDKKAHAQAA
ncbi:MAG TPA: Coq4 family protein [Polyangiales bacterium]